MKYTRILIAVCLMVLLGSGCVQLQTGPQNNDTGPQAEWLAVGEHIQRNIVHFGSEQYDRLVLYKFKKNAFDWRFDYQPEPKPVSQWSSDGSVAAVINGTYFHEDQSPSGMLIRDGKTVGERAFDKDKTGLIDLHPTVRIIDTANNEIDTNTLTSAAQSYPFLIKNGETAIGKDSGLTGRRSFIGTDVDGNVYLGVVPSTRVSLYELANILNNQDIEWENVMNLDGGTSTGLAIRLEGWKETIDSMVPVPSVIIAEPVK